MTKDDTIDAPPDVAELPPKPNNTAEGHAQVAWALLEVAKQLHAQTLALHAILNQIDYANDRLHGMEQTLDNIHTALEGR